MNCPSNRSFVAELLFDSKNRREVYVVNKHLYKDSYEARSLAEFEFGDEDLEMTKGWVYFERTSLLDGRWVISYEKPSTTASCEAYIFSRK